MNPKRLNCTKRPSEFPALTQTHPHPNPLSFGSTAKTGMQAWTKYGEHIVHLLITEELPNKEYHAVIEYFDPILLAPPEDFSKGETVIISEACVWGFNAG